MSDNAEVASTQLMMTPPQLNDPFWVTEVLKRYTKERLPRPLIASAVVRYCPRANHADGCETPEGSEYQEIVSRDVWVPESSRVMARVGMPPDAVELDEEGNGRIPVIRTSGRYEALMRDVISLPLTPAELDAVESVALVPVADSFTTESAIFALIHIIDGLPLERIHKVPSAPVARPAA